MFCLTYDVAFILGLYDALAYGAQIFRNSYIVLSLLYCPRRLIVLVLVANNAGHNSNNSARFSFIVEPFNAL